MVGGLHGGWDHLVVPPAPFVLLDPAENWPSDWACVVVHWATGVTYEHQFGGTACRQGRVEGYLVPVVLGDARTAFDDLFLRRFGGSGIWRAERRLLDADVVKTLTDAVASVAFWKSVPDEVTPHALRLDESRLLDADEAWLPVLTPDGPGDLLWGNSD